MQNLRLTHKNQLSCTTYIHGVQKGDYTQSLEEEGNMKTEHRYAVMIQGIAKALENEKRKEAFALQSFQGV